MIQLFIFPTQQGLISVTVGSTTAVGTNTNFESGDVNKQIIIRTNNGDLPFVISSVIDANHITLSYASPSTQSQCYFTIDFYELDVNQDFAYSFNYNIADIREPDKRNADYSKTITIPGTKNNNNILGQIFEINVDRTFNPNLRADALILEDSIQVFRGNMQLMQVKKTKDLISYDVAVFGALNDLFAKLAVQTVQGTTQIDKLINNLDLSAYDHLTNYTNVYNSWGADYTHGYVYPLINNGLTDLTPANPVFKPTDIYPCVYTKIILDKIISSAGFSYQSTFLNSSFFKKLIIVAPVSPLRNATINWSVNVYSGSYDTAFNPGRNFQYCIMRLNFLTGQQEILFSLQQSITQNDHYTNSGSFSVSGLYPGDQIWAETDNVSPESSPGDIVFNADTDRTGNTLEIIYSTLAYQKDESFKMQLLGEADACGSGIIMYDDPIYNNTGSYNGTTGIATTQPNLAACLPDKVTQRDFLLWIIQMFNLYVMPDRYNPNLLYIEPRDTFYNNTMADWSAKIDVSKEVDIIPMGELDSKYYLFGYKSDSDWYNQYYENLYNENYGDKLVCVNNDFLTETKKIETGFSPTPSTSLPNNSFILPAMIANNTTGTGNNFSGNCRILYYAGLKELPSPQLMYLGGTSFNSYPFAGMIDDPQSATLDLCFEQPRILFWTYNNPASYPTNNLFNTYYSRFMAEISDKNAALVQMYLHLNITDIYLVDFRNLFFIKDCYYRLNKIQDYNPQLQDSVLVEFIKINEAIAIPEPLQRTPNLKNLQGLTTISAQVKPGQLIIGSPDGVAQPVTLSKDIQVVLNETTGLYDLEVTGFQGVPLSTAPPADGAQLQYNASLNRFEWTATATSGAFLQSGFSNGFS